jgi:mannan endo-1,4-beta-mannosidase
MLKKLKYFIYFIAGSLSVSVCYAQTDFVTVKGHQFYTGKRPYQYVGANYWYGGLLSVVKGEQGKKRMQKELDFLKQQGIVNLRVLVGAEGKPGSYHLSVADAVQPEQGKYDARLLTGLDYLLQELGKRKMTAVLYLTNNWQWSGGFSQYLEWNGHGPRPLPESANYNWDKAKAYVTQFYTCDACKLALNKYISYVLKRTNTCTGKKYINDPAIMAWELANEPRPMSQANNEAYLQWIAETAALIKSIDKNHLVTTGSEGDIASDFDMSVYEKANANRNIDYLTIHIWPKNWGWFKDTSISKSMGQVIKNSQEYLNRHIAIAQKLNKPLVIEEFGLPRDKHSFSISSTTGSRDQYYRFLLGEWKKNIQHNGVLNGINFWAVGGTFKPISGQVFWKPGDDYMGDPPQEEQGINAVFNSDASTWKVIRGFSLR